MAFSDSKIPLNKKKFDGKPRSFEKGKSFDKAKSFAKKKSSDPPKPYLGSKPFNTRMRVEKKYGRQTKTDDIKKALTHRASLRRDYFKLLEKEGGDSKPSHEIPNTVPIIGQRESTNDDASETNTEIKQSIYRTPQRKPLSFQERMQIKKERKERARIDKIEKTKQKIEEMKAKDKKRERQTRALKDARTRSGQPLMGPRINNLLDKIKLDIGK